MFVSKVTPKLQVLRASSWERGWVLQRGQRLGPRHFGGERGVPLRARLTSAMVPLLGGVGWHRAPWAVVWTQTKGSAAPHKGPRAFLQVASVRSTVSSGRGWSVTGSGPRLALQAAAGEAAAQSSVSWATSR